MLLFVLPFYASSGVAYPKCDDCHCLLLTPLSQLTASNIKVSTMCLEEVTKACKHSMYASSEECRRCVRILAAEGPESCTAPELETFCDEIKAEIAHHTMEVKYAGVYHLDVDGTTKQSLVASLLR